ncbi:uncharacterized protein LOC122142485 [Tachysurus ichikawai]
MIQIQTPSHQLLVTLESEDFSPIWSSTECKQKSSKPLTKQIAFQSAWSNGKGIINYIVTTPQPVFYKSTGTKDNRHTGPYIADELKAVISKTSSEICKGKQVASVIYFSKQKEKKNENTTLKLPSITPQVGVAIMYDSLLEGKGSLKEMAIYQTAAKESPIKRILLDDVFWERVTSSLRILKPIAAAIARIEGDNAILSDVKCLFAELKKEIQSVLPASMLLQAEETAVFKSMEKCQEQSSWQSGKVPYQTRPLGYGSLASIYLQSTWWKRLCGSEALAPVACIILQIPPTSAASEHNWSLFGTDKKPSSTKLDSDTEDEDESDVGEVDMEDVDEVQEEAIET